MFRSRYLMTVAAAACAATLLLGSCAGTGAENSASGSSADAGDPVTGGTLRTIQMGEPRSMDPASLSNTWAHQPILGNALYGTLLINNPETLEIEYKMATDFSTADGGTTFALTLRPGLTFTDGTPLDAAAVKFNWDRLRDPGLGSTAIRQAAQVNSSEVVDATTLKVTLAARNPHFVQGIVTTSMNWIASPTALAKGTAEFDENPVGAGPFSLTRWSRQNLIELEKNPQYWDAPRPYLDKIDIRTVVDTEQRFNSISTGGTDLTVETSWSTLDKATAAGIPTEVADRRGSDPHDELGSRPVPRRESSAGSSTRHRSGDHQLDGLFRQR
ncbi:UNVERIFIED_CONTAM: extracellular solute-binding protein (family 5) [Williamsia faeni]